MKRILFIIALAVLLCTIVQGQETTTGSYLGLGRNLYKGTTTRTQRHLGRKNSVEKGGKPKAKDGKELLRNNGKTDSHSDSGGDGDDADFYGLQLPSPKEPLEGQRGPSNNKGDSMSPMYSQSDNTTKQTKKSKKSNKDDSHKQSNKLTKKSRLSSSSKGHGPSPPSRPILPSSPPTLSPTRTGGTDPTSSPTKGGSMQHLTQFALEYTVTEDDRIPFRSELLEVVELTRAYLVTYFQDIYEDNNDVTLTEFITVFTDTQSDFGDPVYIAYRSSATFEVLEGDIISVQELDSQLKEAFLGRNLDGYLGMLQALAPSNLFSTTAFVTQVNVREQQQSLTAVAAVGIRTKTSVNGQNAMAGVAAGVTGLTLIGAVGLFYRRQPGASNERPLEKYDGDATSFTTGTWSLDHTSALQPMHGSGRHSLT